jgi:hypothetical protein
VSVQELLAAHPEVALEGRPVLQSLNEVSSEIGVVSRMVALETEALHKLKGHVMSSEANTQQQLVEAHISANASTRVGSEAAKVSVMSIWWTHRGHYDIIYVIELQFLRHLSSDAREF